MSLSLDRVVKLRRWGAGRKPNMALFLRVRRTFSGTEVNHGRAGRPCVYDLPWKDAFPMKSVAPSPFTIAKVWRNLRNMYI